MSLPNIVLFADRRKWEYNFSLCAWRSNDGWTITDQQIADAGDDGWRVHVMLLEHISKELAP